MTGDEVERLLSRQISRTSLLVSPSRKGHIKALHSSSKCPRFRHDSVPTESHRISFNTFIAIVTMNDDYTCRICLEEGKRIDFIAPCACAGSQRWVHRECLDKWRSMREDKAFSRCTECLKPYKMVCLSRDDDTVTFKRRCRFAYMVLRDFSLVLLVSQVAILLLALLVFAFDKHSHLLIDTLHQSARPVLFYYLTGVFFTLSILGMCFTGQMMGCCRGNGTTSSDCGMNDCVCGNVYFPYIYTAPQTGTADCCACCHPECCACCGDATGAGSTGGCAECAGGAAGEECIMVLVVALVAFALVGAVICVVMGVAYVQGLARAHFHVLQKYTLATDFIVADLADGALPIAYRSSSGEEGGSVDENTSVNDGQGGVWSRIGSGRSGSGGYDRAATEDGDLEQGIAIEMSSYTPLHPSLHPSAPPAPVSSGVVMDREGSVTFEDTVMPSAPPAESHVPYDPASHSFSHNQYNDLRRRGLI